jgi:hypothetical protein
VSWTPKGGDFAFETQVIDLTQEISILPYIYVDSDGTHTTQIPNPEVLTPLICQSN